MTTALFTHPACLDHDTSPGHPERADRLRAVLGVLERETFHLLDRQVAPRAERAQITRVHHPDYVTRVFDAVPATGYVGLDADTIISPGSGEAALRAAGALCAAVDHVFAGYSRTAFCAVRPPGHHAMPGGWGGFCLFNNIAIGAAHARSVHGISRVAIIDFDVHHGNGTQAVCEHDPGLFYASTHQAPLYPGTGERTERGDYDNIVNLPLRPLSGSPEFRDVMTRRILPALDEFRPELILISAGFDGHSNDPLASLHLVEDDYAWATRKLVECARTHCDGRVISTLEGGYNLKALAASTAAHVRELLCA